MRRLKGRYRSSLIIGMQGIRSRKTRTVLSMVSLFLGVLAVVVVQAGAEIAHRVLLSNIELTDGKDGTRETRDVELGLTDGKVVQIKSGLTGDETIAVPGPNLPVPKQNNDKGGPDSTSGPK